MDQRAAIEEEINALIEALSGNLTDSEVKPCSFFPLFACLPIVESYVYVLKYFRFFRSSIKLMFFRRDESEPYL
jgi:hypothetical protein